MNPNIATFSCLAVEVYADHQHVPAPYTWGEVELLRKEDRAQPPLFTVWRDRQARASSMQSKANQALTSAAIRHETGAAQLSVDRHDLFSASLPPKPHDFQGWLPPSQEMINDQARRDEQAALAGSLPQPGIGGFFT